MLNYQRVFLIDSNKIITAHPSPKQSFNQTPVWDYVSRRCHQKLDFSWNFSRDLPTHWKQQTVNFGLCPNLEIWVFPNLWNLHVSKHRISEFLKKCKLSSFPIFSTCHSIMVNCHKFPMPRTRCPDWPACRVNQKLVVVPPVGSQWSEMDPISSGLGL